MIKRLPVVSFVLGKATPPMVNRSVPRRSNLECGQALTEFIVLALALIPLFLLIPIIAKYQDIAYATQIASRYVAFDVMTRADGNSSSKPQKKLEDEVRRRFFGNSDAPIKTDDGR